MDYNASSFIVQKSGEAFIFPSAMKMLFNGVFIKDCILIFCSVVESVKHTEFLAPIKSFSQYCNRADYVYEINCFQITEIYISFSETNLEFVATFIEIASVSLQNII